MNNPYYYGSKQGAMVPVPSAPVDDEAIPFAETAVLPGMVPPSTQNYPDNWTTASSAQKHPHVTDIVTVRPLSNGIGGFVPVPSRAPASPPVVSRWDHSYAGKQRLRIVWEFLWLGKARRYPPVTLLIVLGCLIAFVRSLGQGFAPVRENFMLGPRMDALVKAGAKFTPLILAGQYYRLFTAFWLHAGVVHLLINMLSFWKLGKHLETSCGPLRYSAIYLLSGLASVISSTMFLPVPVSVGASGAVFGVLGAVLAEVLVNAHLRRSRKECMCEAFALIFSAALNLVIGLLVPFVDNAAHGGGFVCGFLLGLACCPKFTTASASAGPSLIPQRSTRVASLRGLIGIGITATDAVVAVPSPQERRVVARRTLTQVVVAFVAGATALGLIIGCGTNLPAITRVMGTCTSTFCRIVKGNLLSIQS